LFCIRPMGKGWSTLKVLAHSLILTFTTVIHVTSSTFIPSTVIHELSTTVIHEISILLFMKYPHCYSWNIHISILIFTFTTVVHTTFIQIFTFITVIHAIFSCSLAINTSYLQTFTFTFTWKIHMKNPHYSNSLLWASGMGTLVILFN